MQNTLKTNNCFNLYKAFQSEGFFYGIVKFNRKARKDFYLALYLENTSSQS